MKISILSATVLALGMSLVSAAATAADRSALPAVQNGRDAAKAMPGAKSPAPLKGNLRLSPNAKLRVGHMLKALQVKLEQLNQKFATMNSDAAVYELGMQLMPNITKECSSKAYTVQDQMAAGCKGSDTVDQCTDKLYKHCVATFATSGFSMPSIPGAPATGGGIPSYSTQQFKQAALKTASEAHALSQMLNLYANQATQNANSFTP